ncbi:MAG: heme lyase CcmF/NrfE family subunit [Myxococcales bacterium]|nr:heme lyase CcmF/NrfE family subunit [Myxococcales bacterium]
MISLLGRGLVLAALFFAATGCLAGFWAGYFKNERAWEGTRNSAYGFALSMIAANLVMVYALITHDFSVSYVAEVGSKSTPFIFTVVSLWASLNGSILFWGGVLGLYTALTVWSLGDKYREYTPWALHVLMGVSIFFCFLVASIANPFAPTPPGELEMIAMAGDGPGPNPLLQNHWLMSVHPPMLYLGYVGMSVPFSLICAALLAGRLEAGWMVPVRRWMLIPWMFLTVGIVLGGWWSYAVLGWGGAWAWDPVENASFHPWLTGTAFLHSAMVLQRKGKLRDWTLILGMSTFLLTLLGTFMTRSGVFNSVHSFTQSDIGPVFLVFLALVFVYSIVLLALRSHVLDEEAKATDARIGARNDLAAALSRDTSILLQNVVFGAFTFMVLIGTLYPLMAEALTEKRLSVGEPYFDKYALPLGLILVFLMGVGPALPWGRSSPEHASRRFLPSVGVGVLFVAVYGLLGPEELSSRMSMPWTLLALFLVGFAFWSNLYEFVEPVTQRMRARNEKFTEAVPKVWNKARRRFGGHIAHFGVLCAVFSLTMVKGFRVEHEFNMNSGEQVEFNGYQVTFEGARDDSEPHRTSTVARFAVEGIGAFEPRLNYYTGRGGMAGQPIFTPAVHSTLTSDLYFSILQVSQDKSNVIIRLIHEPFQVWLWFSAPIVALGTLIAVWPMRRSRKEGGADTGASPAEATA